MIFRDSKVVAVNPTGPLNDTPVSALLTREVSVPEIPGGESDEPLDLGHLELTAPQNTAAAK